MGKQAKLLTIILGISLLCGCDTTFGVGKLDEMPKPLYEIVDYSAVKEGYYLSDSGDGSYYLIKHGKITLANFDWEKDFRERAPISEYSDMTASEYEEFVSECLEEDIRNYTDKPFTPVKYDGFDVYVILVINPSPEDIASNGFNSLIFGPEMKDENTIGTEPHFYTYCGTSLPENVQTQTSD